MKNSREMVLYHKNLNILKKNHPHVYDILSNHCETNPFNYRIFETSSHQVNATINRNRNDDVMLYEESDIIENIQTKLLSKILNKNDLLMCIGMGLGYIPLTAARIYSESPQIVILERFPEMFKLALSSMDLSDLFTYENLDIYLGTDFNVSDAILKYADQMYVGSCRRISHLPSRKIFGEKFVSLEQEISENINLLGSGWETGRIYGYNIFENSVKNLTSLFNGITIDRLKDKFCGFPAVCVASGPSLENDIHTLKRIKDRVIILACDSAVRPLVKEGIVPHIVFAVDHQNCDFEKIRENLEAIRDTILVYLMDANADSVRGFLGKKRVAAMSGNTFIQGLLVSQFGIDFQLPGFVSSNADAAVLTAVVAGADPVILVGMDLALSEGKDHAHGAVFRTHIEDAITTEGVNGYDVYSLNPLVTGKKVLEKNIQFNKRTYVDTSLAGAFVQGTKIQSLEELAQTVLKGKINFNKLVEKIDWNSGFKKIEVLRAFENLNSAIRDLKNDAVKSMKDVCTLLKNDDNTFNAKISIKIRDLLKNYSLFKKQYRTLLLMINNQRYADQLEIDRKIANLGSNGQLSIAQLNRETLKIQKQFFRSVYICSRKTLSFLESRKCYYEGVWGSSGLLHEGSSLHLELARAHADEGVIWLAEEEYLRHLSEFPGSYESICGLVNIYMSMRMWEQAINTINQYAGKYLKSCQVDDLKKRIKNKLNHTLILAKEKFKQYENGKKDKITEARLGVMEYLSVFSEDSEALDLLRKIEESENQQTDNLIKKQGVTYEAEEVAWLRAKASRLAKEGELEKSIGIYEGLIRQLPDDEADYRLKIGDIRFQQGDFISAWWNYNKGADLSEDNVVFLNRIRFAKPFVGIKRLSKADQLKSLSIIVPISDFSDDTVRRILAFSKKMTPSHELIVVCRNEDKKTSSEILNQFNSDVTLCLVGCDGPPLSPCGINTALERTTGQCILMTGHDLSGLDMDLEDIVKTFRTPKKTGLMEASKIDVLSYQDRRKAKADYHRSESAMAVWPDLPIWFKRDLLETIGLFDEFCQSTTEMLEDYRIRANMAGFHNIAVTKMNLYEKNEHQNDMNVARLKNKWRPDNLPEWYQQDYFITEICEKAQALWEKGRTTEAFTMLADGIKVYPDCEAFYTGTAQFLIFDNRYEEAVEVLKLIPATATEKSDFYNALLARALIGAGETEKAQTMADKLLDEKPENARLLNLKGSLAYTNQQFNVAETFFRAAVMSDYSDGMGWFNLGRVKFRTGDIQKAYRLIRKGFLMSGNTPEIMREYHFLVEHLERLEEGAMDFKRAVNMYPGNKELHYLYIDLLMKCGNFVKAMAYIEESIVKFGMEDGILDAALSVREKIGLENKNRYLSQKNKTDAVIHIHSDLKDFAVFLHDLKQRAHDIFFVNSENTPLSGRLAAVFGATLISDKPEKMMNKEGLGGGMLSGCDRIEFQHHDVVAWLSEYKNNNPEYIWNAG